MNFNNEELKQAKMAKSAEELIVLAKEKGIELTEEQAQLYFAQLNPQSGEIADDELDNVAGGSCECYHRGEQCLSDRIN